jgi:tyrosyl-tRNA synthetase
MSATMDPIMRDAEVVTEEELQVLLDTGGGKAYIGFEPSGLVHVGWLVCIKKMREIADAGFELTVYLADWHAFVNDKLGGDMDTIRLCGEYLKEVFDTAQVPCKYLYASELMDSIEYWDRVMRVMKATTLARTKRAMTVMGRKEDEADADTSKFLYPGLQVADIFQMDLDLALGGMDQRHAHMLQRDVADKLGWKKAVAVHTPLISGLTAGGRMDPVEGKMSKSSPDGTISIHDPAEDVRRKMKKAFCPESAEGNPVVEIIEHVIFPYDGGFTVLRDEKWGGDIEYEDIGQLISDLGSKQVHPQDLKMSTAAALDGIIEPFRSNFHGRSEMIDTIQNAIGR